MDNREELVEKDISGESVCGFRVAAYRETHPEHGDKYGHIYSKHWSTPSYRDPRVKVERLFTEDQLRAALSTSRDGELREALEAVHGMVAGFAGSQTTLGDVFKIADAALSRLSSGEL
jgi:hypothetical protein